MGSKWKWSLRKGLDPILSLKKVAPLLSFPAKSSSGKMVLALSFVFSFFYLLKLECTFQIGVHLALDVHFFTFRAHGLERWRDLADSDHTQNTTNPAISLFLNNHQHEPQ